MTPQELLASLSQLEQELQSVKSARVLAEDTIQAYSDVKKDIRILLSEFDSVTNSLNSLAHSFENENQTLSDEIQNSIRVVKGQLETLNTAFANQCNSVILKFMESINSATVSLKTKTESLSSTYEAHNNTFKSRIEELTSVHNSLIKATDSVVSLKSDIANLQKELNDSQKGQDETLEKIASDLEKTGNNHTQILNQIAKDLKKSQEAQDEDLDQIKRTQNDQVQKLDTLLSNSNQQDSDIKNNHSEILKEFTGNKEISKSIFDKISSFEDFIGKKVRINMLLIILNILITLAALVIALAK